VALVSGSLANVKHRFFILCSSALGLVALLASTAPVQAIEPREMRFAKPIIRRFTPDINRFWSETYAQEYEGRYRPPRHVRLFNSRRRIHFNTPCGKTIPNNAAYCRPNESIYLDATLMNHLVEARSEGSQTGDYVVVAWLVHEWGHHIQKVLKWPYEIARRLKKRAHVELQADCFAGAYTADALKRGLINGHDYREGLRDAWLGGDRLYWNEPGAHGSRRLRRLWFRAGFQHDDVTVCNKVFAQDAPGGEGYGG
jgi:predicted metalloprotease